MVLLPAAWWVGRSWIEVALLAGSVMGVLIVELLNSAIEAAVDRVSSELHPLSKRAKDIGSAAVMLSLISCGGAVVRGVVAALGGRMTSPKLRRLRLLRFAPRRQPGVHAQRANSWAARSGAAAGSSSTAAGASA